MSDISTVEEGLRADCIGFDLIGTTLFGYTEQSKDFAKFEVLKELSVQFKYPVIAEGNLNTPETAAKAMGMGAYAVVVSSVITSEYCSGKGSSALVVTSHRNTH